MSLPYISVIIRAFNRREFVIKSIESCLKQTLSREKYEIIVVKNFYDEQIDRYLTENNVIVLEENGIAGKLIKKGIEASKGEVICFLDDDDEFIEEKLEYVYNAFKENKRLGYLHNGFVPVDESGKVTLFHHDTIDFGMSNISIRKAFVRMDVYDAIAFFQDPVTYAMLLDANCSIRDTDIKLTRYMVHPSTSNLMGSSFEQWVEETGIRFRNYLGSAVTTLNLLTSKRSKSYMRAMITDLNMGRFQFEKQLKVRGVTNFLLCKDIPGERRFMQFRSYMFIRLFGERGRKYILKKREIDFENSHKK